MDRKRALASACAPAVWLIQKVQFGSETRVCPCAAFITDRASAPCQPSIILCKHVPLIIIHGLTVIAAGGEGGSRLLAKEREKTYAKEREKSYDMSTVLHAFGQNEARMTCCPFQLRQVHAMAHCCCRRRRRCCCCCRHRK